ncbi:hypothetical protein NLU13_5291 [Sarocladium strictum]|uniref:Major facilitator superfamily (MFS) profile domain-containing protein n=1 Tax=Sarocladium strictum TaxID=5046 RepID=A0AA39GGL0_SARSR|nr:hypothetical protein NLU13_5291 [Sarocladium strictum]
MATPATADEKAKAGSAQHAEYGPGYTSAMARIEAAAQASDEESRLSRKELFSRYRPAVIYSALLSLALVMEGMDVGLVNNFFGQDAYIRKFGWPDAQGNMHISATWQAAIGNGNNLGSIIGLLLNGYLQSRFGSRRVYMVAMVLMACFIFVLFFAVNVQMLLVGNILCGIPWGIFQTNTTAYAAEITPAALRGYLTAWVSMCWGCGSFLAAGILYGSLQLPGDSAYRVPYGLQWVWIPPLFLVAFFAPESPWYLVRRGKIEEAEKNIRRLARKDYYTDEMMADTVALMKHTNEMERVEAEDSSYADCFRGTNFRRTLIVMMAWWVQIFNGQGITAYATIFLRSVGMSESNAFRYSMAIQSVNIVATGTAIILMGKIGRRLFYLFGTASIGVCMLAIGIMGFAATRKQVAVPVAVFMIITNLCFKLSLGPSCYTIVGEMSSNRVRAQTIVIGRAIYVCGQIASNQLNPRMLNDNAGSWNWGPRAGIFYFGFDVVWFIWTWFYLPETKNRSFADIDYLFQKKTPAREFTTAPIDLFEITAAEKSNKLADDDLNEKSTSDGPEGRR